MDGKMSAWLKSLSSLYAWMSSIDHSQLFLEYQGISKFDSVATSNCPDWLANSCAAWLRISFSGLTVKFTVMPDSFVNSPACFCSASICGLLTIKTLIVLAPPPPPPPPAPPAPPAPAQAEVATNNADKPAAAATLGFQSTWSPLFLVSPLQGP